MAGVLAAWLLRCLGLRRRKLAAPTTPDGNPLPPVVHLVLEPDDLAPGRLIIIGDVHGCQHELVVLLEKVAYRPRHDNLILVGDLVNKGYASQQVVATARAWCASACCWCVQGNHDGAALAAAAQAAAGGGIPDPKFDWVQQLTDEDRAFLQQLPFSIQVRGYEILVVHAALVPGLPLEQQDLAVLTKARDLLPAPHGGFIALEKPTDDSVPWASRWSGPGHVFFGHDAKRGLQLAPAATGLDTGCVYGRELTCVVLPPLPQLRAGSGGSSSRQLECAGAEGAHALPATPTLQQLGGEVHSVPSSFMCDKAVEKAAKKALKAARKAHGSGGGKQRADVLVKDD